MLEKLPKHSTIYIKGDHTHVSIPTNSGMLFATVRTNSLSSQANATISDPIIDLWHYINSENSKGISLREKQLKLRRMYAGMKEGFCVGQSVLLFDYHHMSNRYVKCLIGEIGVVLKLGEGALKGRVLVDFPHYVASKACTYRTHWINKNLLFGLVSL